MIEQAPNDRQILIDCIHHSDVDCDKAAIRLAQSKDHADRSLAKEWLAMRSREARK